MFPELTRRCQRSLSGCGIYLQVWPRWVFYQIQGAHMCPWRYTASASSRQLCCNICSQDIRALVAISAAPDLENWHLDVVNAFANSVVNETIYCELASFSGSCLLMNCRNINSMWKREYCISLRGTYSLYPSYLLFFNTIIQLFAEIKLKLLPSSRYRINVTLGT